MLTSRHAAGSNTVVADSRGMTVYVIRAKGAQAEPLCAGRCTYVWRPVLLLATQVSSVVPGTSLRAGVLPRPGGQNQLTLNGHRVYTYSGDHSPGDVNGDGFITSQGGTTFSWHVISLPGVPPPRTLRLTPTGGPTPTSGSGR